MSGGAKPLNIRAENRKRMRVSSGGVHVWLNLGRRPEEAAARRGRDFRRGAASNVQQWRSEQWLGVKDAVEEGGGGGET